MAAAGFAECLKSEVGKPKGETSVRTGCFPSANPSGISEDFARIVLAVE
jgi:hypothetical protein